ncbi:MAG: NifU family protein [Phycisphaeraceae bacterium]
MPQGSKPSQPANPSQSQESLFDRVAAVIERIRPAVQSDGGDLELVGITDEGVVQVRLHGACIGCPSSSMTLQMGIERNVREKIPEVTGVEQVS